MAYRTELDVGSFGFRPLRSRERVSHLQWCVGRIWHMRRCRLAESRPVVRRRVPNTQVGAGVAAARGVNAGVNTAFGRHFRGLAGNKLGVTGEARPGIGAADRIGLFVGRPSQRWPKSVTVAAHSVGYSPGAEFWAPSTLGRRKILEVGGWRLGVDLGRLRSSQEVCWGVAAKRGRKKFRKRRMRFFFRVTRASGASDIGDGCGRGAGTAPRNGTALGRRAGRVWGVVLGARRPGLTGDFRPRRAKNVFLAFFTLRRVRRCAV